MIEVHAVLICDNCGNQAETTARLDVVGPVCVKLRRGWLEHQYFRDGDVYESLHRCDLDECQGLPLPVPMIDTRRYDEETDG